MNTKTGTWALFFIFSVISTFSCTNTNDKNNQPLSSGSQPSISESSLKKNIETLAGFETRHTLSELDSSSRGIGAARDWLLDEFSSYSKQADGKMEAKLNCFQKWGRKNCNVYALLRGTESPDEWVIVSGHYDSRASQSNDARSRAPGANDDASGVAVTLEMARILSATQPKRTLVFLATVAEEQGLVGAKHFVDLIESQSASVVAMITNDIVGSSEGYDGGRSDKHRSLQKDENRLRLYHDYQGTYHTRSRQFAQFVKDRISNSLPSFTIDVRKYVDRPGRSGDHVAFLRAGKTAIRFTEPYENLQRQHQDVRLRNGVQYGDLPEFIDYAFLSKVAKINLIILQLLGDGVEF